jgi:hypothetical protein
MKTKYGFVIILDGMGTKTETIEDSINYLNKIGNIEQEIKAALSATLPNDEAGRKFFYDIPIRFFGDTLLMTYEVKDKSLEYKYFIRLCFVVETFICRALSWKLLFRGSISLGEYIEEGSVVLGPAVFDAASWYEKLNMVGVITTPHTTSVLKSIFIHQFADQGLSHPDIWHCGFLDNHPLKTPDAVETFALNWPRQIFVIKDENETEEEWFYRTMRIFSVPTGTELKFQNTERFFLKSYKSDLWKSAFKPKTSP